MFDSCRLSYRLRLEVPTKITAAPALPDLGRLNAGENVPVATSTAKIRRAGPGSPHATPYAPRPTGCQSHLPIRAISASAISLALDASRVPIEESVRFSG